MSEKLYDDMLTAVLEYQAVPKEVLLAMNKNLCYSQLTLRRAVENGHLRINEDRPVRRNNHQLTEKTLTITRSGIRYLTGVYETDRKRNETDGSGWIRNISPDWIKKASVYGRQLADSEVKRVAEMGEAGLMCKLAGMSVSPVPNFWIAGDGTCSENGEGERRYSYIEILKRAKGEDGKKQRDFLMSLNRSNSRELPDGFMRFLNIRDIKNGFLLNGSRSHDYDRCTAAGIADSGRRVLMLYCHHDIGFKWERWSKEVDLKILGACISRFSILSNGLDPDMSKCAAVFVKNAQEFKRIYLDTDGVRRWTEKEGEDFRRDSLGDGLGHLYAIPKNRCGVDMLAKLMEYTDAEVSEYYVRRLADLPETERDDRYPEVFPVSYRSVPFSVGVFMDIKGMKRMELLKARRAVDSFGIFCLDWQIPYYRCIFPESEIIDVEKVLY